MTQIKIDEDAHRILIETKKRMEYRGIESPTLSGAIREIFRQALEKREERAFKID